MSGSNGRPRILIAESKDFSPQVVEMLEDAGEVVLADLDRDELLAAARDASVLWVRLRNRIDAEVIAAAPQLRAIVSPTTGLNHIDLEAAERRGIAVVSLRGETDFLKEIRATGEHTLALMLALLRRLPAAARHAAEGGWDRDLFRGAELYEKTVGVVGYGRLGRIVARYLAAFDARVLANDGKDSVEQADPGVTAVPLPVLLAESEIVTLHASLTSDSERFFGPEQFAAMRSGAYFVNTARGELVDEPALLEALETGRLAGAALDVLAGEDARGMRDHPLLAYAREHDNLIVTPHIAGGTTESMLRTERFMAGRLLNVLASANSGAAVAR